MTLLETLCAVEVSRGFPAGIRGRAARRLEKKFLGHLQTLLASAPLLHADEIPGRAAGSLAYVQVTCTEYLTLMHVGDRRAVTIDAGGVLTEFTGVLVRAGYQHLDAVRAARERGADRLDEATLTQIRNHYLGALSRGQIDNQGERSKLAEKARTLIRRFRRFEDMILRFATNLSVPFTNNEAERSCRPVKVQQRTSGGACRTLPGRTDFAIVQSYLDTATKGGQDKLDVLHQLFTTGAWPPPTLKPAE